MAKIIIGIIVGIVVVLFFVCIFCMCKVAGWADQEMNELEEREFGEGSDDD